MTIAVFMFDSSTKVYMDNDPDDLERSIPPTAFHRSVDLAIVEADNEGQPELLRFAGMRYALHH